MPPSVDLYWLPLGAGGHFVAINGCIYESIVARRDHRDRLDIYHTALVVSVLEGRFVIENAWPIPDARTSGRGVVVQGPVGAPILGHFRAFRYEVRCWRDGTIADIDAAVASPQLLSDDDHLAHALLELIPSIPVLTWGRKPYGCVEMWNSNSVISWLLTRVGVDMDRIEPPPRGRAPGWATGVALANDIDKPSHTALPTRA